jgi:hypothetical protein
MMNTHHEMMCPPLSSRSSPLAPNYDMYATCLGVPLELGWRWSTLRSLPGRPMGGVRPPDSAWEGTRDAWG